MKLSLNWLKEYLDITEVPAELARLITLHIAEVERVVDQAARFEHVVVGQIKNVRPHPQADKLKLCEVDCGAGVVQIVCGGSNLMIGQWVVVAQPGAYVKWHGAGDLIELQTAKIRGETSHGMICAAVELGLEDLFPAQTEREIIDLKDYTVTAGQPLAQVLELNDVIIEIENKTLTHRADLFSHRQFAQELSVILQRPLKLLALPEAEGSDQVPLHITSTDLKLCSRYLGVVLAVKPQSSPVWLQRRLQALDIRPINVIVDITNYVMAEYGQPLHAFDYDQLKQGEITVRLATAGEKLQTLDHKERLLSPTMLVIADPTGPVALAGIMGGVPTAVTDQTQRIMLEAALFDKTSVRLTSRHFGLRTEASTRFEKGVGYTTVSNGFWRAIQLLQELAEAQVVSSIVTTSAGEPNRCQLELTQTYINDYLGASLAAAEIQRILTGLGFGVEVIADTYKVTVPLHRTDITGQQDIIEEIARIYGYDTIPTQPLLASLQPPVIEPVYALGKTIIQRVTSFGAYEVMNYSFYSEATAKQTQVTGEHLALVNPMNPDQQLLRRSLVPNLLKNVQLNLQLNQTDFTIVEYGHVYSAGIETKLVAGCVVGDKAIFKAKGMVEVVLQGANVGFTVTTTDQSVEYYLANAQSPQLLASASNLPLSILEQFDIQQPVASFQFELTTLAQYSNTNYQFKPISAYPHITLDISLAVPQTVTWQQLQAAIQQQGEPYIRTIEVFDIYHNPADHGIMTYGIRFVLQATDRTLTMAEAETIRTAMINYLVKQFGVRHRI